MDLITPEFGLVIWMIISFGIVLFILKKLAWKPILKAIEQRENTIENSLQSAKHAKEEMSKVKADNEKILEQAKIERNNIINEGREIKEKIVNDARDEATKETQSIIDDARRTINNEKLAAIEEMKTQIVELSVNIAEKVISNNLKNDEAQRDYIKKTLDELNIN